MRLEPETFGMFLFSLLKGDLLTNRYSSTWDGNVFNVTDI